MKKCVMILILSFILVGFSGCNKPSQTNISNDEIAECYRHIYEQSLLENRLGGTESVKAIVECLGENGYVAVDSDNQVNMVNSERVVDFNEDIQKERASELTILSVLETGGFIRYDLCTEDGEVNVSRSSFDWNEESFGNNYIKEYTASNWILSENGYLFWGEAHDSGQDNPAGQVAMRVAFLDDKCREFNQKYIMPIGYNLNNMFITDWNETDYGELNFYDLYETLYELKFGYLAFVESEKEGKTYEIPTSEFESVFRSYFQIDTETLHQKTVYQSDSKTYQYRARGMHDHASTPNIPYPEVVGYEENTDGTIKLIVNAVWSEKYLDKAFQHEVVVRILQDGTFQYVSNRVVPSEENVEFTWYVERLTEEEWEKYYGASQLEETAMSAVEKCIDIYKEVEIVNPDSAYSYMMLTDEQRQIAVKRLGAQGLVCVSDDINMENYEEVERFYSDYISGKNTEVTIYNVKQSGLITAQIFVHQEGKLQFYFVGMEWTKDGNFHIVGSGVNDLKEIVLTEKGYFIYQNENIIEHANLREYFRVNPLSDECRELTEKYISGLSYINYNMLVTDWNENNVEDILMPCMFEDIYRIHTGENLEVENGQIPADIYEEIMTTYFPVSKEQLQKYCGYDGDINSYEYDMIFAKPYPPFGEVVGCTYNDDGTITLIVDGIWPDYNSDQAFVNHIVVQPFEDGTFRYLSNYIEQGELAIPEVVNDKTQNEVITEASLVKGYDLSVDESLKNEAESDCLDAMEQIRDIYMEADKGTSLNVNISEETVQKMVSVLSQSGYPTILSELFSCMINYSQMESFLEDCSEGKSGEVILYEVHLDGGIGRKAFIFDGLEMYELGTKAIWTKENTSMIAYTSYNRIERWEYTQKGWFSYEYCVPEPPEVSEIVNGNVLIRVKPMSEEYRQLAEKYLIPIGYQGNNLFRINWDEEHMEFIDYNGLFEYFYFIEYGEQFETEENRANISKVIFENLMTKYLPVTVELLEKYASYNEEKGTYSWERLGCTNYTPDFFDTSSPEIIKFIENKDGTLTLTVDAVCEKLGTDLVIQHEVTLELLKDGSVRYLKNKILNNGIKYIPAYQYRIQNE